MPGRRTWGRRRLRQRAHQALVESGGDGLRVAVNERYAAPEQLAMRRRQSSSSNGETVSCCHGAASISARTAA